MLTLACNSLFGYCQHLCIIEHPIVMLIVFLSGKAWPAHDWIIWVCVSLAIVGQYDLLLDPPCIVNYVIIWIIIVAVLPLQYHQCHGCALPVQLLVIVVMSSVTQSYSSLDLEVCCYLLSWLLLCWYFFLVDSLRNSSWTSFISSTGEDLTVVISLSSFP